MQKIFVLDTTLREGQQACGIRFSLQEKIELAKKLKAFGVDIIEIGHPGISPAEEEIAKKICAAIQCVDFLVHARALEEDIIAAKNTKATWVGIWASYNDISLQTKFKNKSREWIKTQVKESILLAKKLGLKVRFTIEDASRTPEYLIEELGKIAVNAGADRISLADTVGVWHPKECSKAVQHALTCFNNISVRRIDIEVHLHNDLGLAQANAIAALDAGASVIDASLLGIGERAGICDLAMICNTLKQFYPLNSKNYDLSLSQELAQFVSRIGAFKIEPHHPIVGRHVFTHVSKYHIKATENNPEAYESLKPEDFGSKRKSLLNTSNLNYADNVNNLNSNVQQRYLNNLQIKKPFIKGASELLHHRDGVGLRWVFMDNRIDARSPVYIIERIFDKDYQDDCPPHVDSHAHHCDSVFVFMGNESDGTGLTASVTFGAGENQTTEIFSSPASIFIPAHVFHTYTYIKGIGRFLNFVLSPNYNASIVES